MIKPLPKREIAVVKTPTPGYFTIFCVTEDASNWLIENAEEFGKLSVPNMYDNFFTFTINPCYDADEVFNYFNSMGKDDNHDRN